MSNLHINILTQQIHWHTVTAFEFFCVTKPPEDGHQ
jgi:hypothetical protein